MNTKTSEPVYHVDESTEYTDVAECDIIDEKDVNNLDIKCPHNKFVNAEVTVHYKTFMNNLFNDNKNGMIEYTCDYAHALRRYFRQNYMQYIEESKVSDPDYMESFHGPIEFSGGFPILFRVKLRRRNELQEYKTLDDYHVYIHILNYTERMRAIPTKPMYVPNDLLSLIGQCSKCVYCNEYFNERSYSYVILKKMYKTIIDFSFFVSDNRNHENIACLLHNQQLCLHKIDTSNTVARFETCAKFLDMMSESFIEVKEFSKTTKIDEFVLGTLKLKYNLRENVKSFDVKFLFKECAYILRKFSEYAATDKKYSKLSFVEFEDVPTEWNELIANVENFIDNENDKLAVPKPKQTSKNTSKKPKQTRK